MILFALKFAQHSVGGIPVVPVLLEGASLRPESELPNDIKPLARRECRTRWTAKLRVPISRGLQEGLG